MTRNLIVKTAIAAAVALVSQQAVAMDNSAYNANARTQALWAKSKAPQQRTIFGTTQSAPKVFGTTQSVVPQVRSLSGPERAFQRLRRVQPTPSGR